MAHLFTTAGEHTIKFTAGVFETGYTFEVVGLELVEMRLVTPPSQLSYEVGSDFNTTGMKLMGTYNTGKIDEITEYEITGFDSSTATDCCTVTICCEKCSCSVDVEILPSLYLSGEKTDGTMELIYYLGHDTDIVVPKTVKRKQVTSISASCFAYSDVKSVEIPEGIVYIG